MKSRTSSILRHTLRTIVWVATLLAGAISWAQTYDETYNAFERGDYTIAVEGFRKLAEQGDRRAQGLLGILYYLGRGVAKDDRQAAMWYRKSAEQGSAVSQNSLGELFVKGEGVPADSAQAIFWFRKSADQGYSEAQFNLGRMYSGKHGIAKDDVLAAHWYQKAAEQGNAEAQLGLGLAYVLGKGLPQNPTKAYFWWLLASAQGNKDAASILNDVRSDLTPEQRASVETEARNWKPKIEALANDPQTALNGDQTSVGAAEMPTFQDADAAYKRGDYPSALGGFAKLAEQGDTAAQTSLSVMYSDGLGVPRDYAKAVFWQQKAADKGDRLAQYLLGENYFRGRGVVKDYTRALALYARSAESGFSLSQRNLGFMYFNGEGVPKDEQRAYFWWLLASAKGNKQAADMRDRVERQLTAEQRATAQAAARNWKPQSAEKGTAPENTPIPPVQSQAQPTSTGSGFRVARGSIITNHHVIEGCSRLRVNGDSTQVLSSDTRSDLALLSATLPGPNAVLRAQRAAVGEPVAVAGYPLRGLLSGFNMTTGTLSSLSGIGGDTRLVQITAPVQPGNSGGPLLDSSGNLMGVVVSKLDAIKAAKITGDIPQNVNFAINANVLRSFLDANSVEYENAKSDKALPTTSIAERAKGLTVLVECWK